MLNLKKKDAQQVLEDALYFELMDIESEILLDKTLFEFFDRRISKPWLLSYIF